MPATHTLQRGTGAATSVEGVTWGANLSRTRQGTVRANSCCGFRQLWTNPSQCVPGNGEAGKRETMCSSVAFFSLPSLGLFWYQGLQEPGYLF